MREITIATVQMKPELGNSENNLVKMSDFVSTIASQQKVDLIVFPELVTSGYELGVRFTEIAQRVPGPAINLMAQRAADAGVYIAFGLAIKEKVESILYNAAVLVGPEGELLGAYSKVHLRGEERMAFREGFKLPVIDTGEIGKIGLMIGWDLAFPEVARSLALDGAELVCSLANWENAYIDEWKTFVRARAMENAIYVAAANRVGTDVTMSFGGESMIVGPRGTIHASLETARAEQLPLLKEEKKPAGAALAAPVEIKKEAEAKKDGEAPATASAPAAAAPTEAKKPAEAAQPDAARPDIKRPGVKIEAAEGFCVARIDLDEVRRCREEFQTLQSRHPTVYRTIVKKY